ncbi:hypothetical protein RUND412_004505 [Rhizina undulata]
MPPIRASTVFRIKDVPSMATATSLEQILREKLSPDECQKDTKWALVDFHPKVPEFLHDVANDKTESQRLFLEAGDRNLTIDVNFYGFTQLYEVKAGTEIAAEAEASTPLKTTSLEFLKEIAKVRSSEESLVEAAARKSEKDALAGNQNLVASTCAVMFFGTPHRGISMDDVRKMLEEDDHNPRIGLLEEIEKGLNLEPDLNDFVKLATAEGFKNAKNAYTRSGNFKSTLDTDSALLGLSEQLEEAILVNADHTSIVKFDHRQDTTYEDVVKRVRKYLDTALDHVTERFQLQGSAEVAAEPPTDTSDPLMRVAAPTNSRRKSAILHGMGGVGKSQIALEYAHRFSHCYSSIFWIDVDGSSRKAKSVYAIVAQLVNHYATKWPSSSTGFEEIAKTLGIPGELDPSGKISQDAIDVAIKAVHAWLSAQENRGWLLLIDNYDKAEEGELDNLIPTCDWGSIVVTTRLPDLQRFGKCVMVEGFGAEAGLRLLLESSGKAQQNVAKSGV